MLSKMKLKFEERNRPRNTWGLDLKSKMLDYNRHETWNRIGKNKNDKYFATVKFT